MKYFPFFVKLAGERVVVAGGGEQAAQKVRLLLKSEARIDVMAPTLEAELLDLLRAGRIHHIADVLDRATLEGARVVVCATGCAGADAAIAALGRNAGALVNAVDRPDLCDAITPAIVDRDPVVVAIGTEGTAPVLARRIKTAVEQMLDPSLGGFAAWAGSLRSEVAQRLAPGKRRAFWAWAFSGELESVWRREGLGAVAAEAERVIAQGGAAAPGGSVSLVGAGPGSADLITLRGVQRLQEADVIFYDRLVDPAVLELARRDAERVFVGKAPGVPQWSQARINRLLVAAAREGKRVVRLKCGDPGIFGRASDELAALREASFAVEIVPGVTAASAAAAEVGRSLTDRDGGRSLVLASGHPATGAASIDWTAVAAMDATVAIYMGVARGDETARALISGGASPEALVDIVENAGSRRSRRITARLSELGDALKCNRVRNPAMLLVSPPKQHVESISIASAARGGLSLDR